MRTPPLPGHALEVTRKREDGKMCGPNMIITEEPIHQHPEGGQKIDIPVKILAL